LATKSFVASSLLIAVMAWPAAARAAPPLPEPEIPPQPAPSAATPASPPPPASPASPPPSAPDATYPSSSGATSSPPPPSFGPKDSPFAPPPNLSKNPIDALPGDVIYPPDRNKPSRPVLWNPEWPRFSTADWIITGTGAAITIAAAIIPPQSKHSLGGGIAFDDGARKTLRLPTSEGRYVARDGSDVILSLEATWPFFVDALITTWWYRGSPDAAAQMALVDGEALAIVTAIQGATNTLVSRERPYGQICGTPELPDQTNDCEGNVRYRSFFSGHSAFTFMAAGLICVHHQKLDLLGGAGDDIACVTAYAGAAATATLRVMGDMHYASDVAIGAGVGTLVGLAVPLIHYRRVNLAPTAAGVDLTLIPVGAGLGVGGTF
jgi:membrane-associated phospholipid phosphatase